MKMIGISNQIQANPQKNKFKNIFLLFQIEKLYPVEFNNKIKIRIDNTKSIQNILQYLILKKVSLFFQKKKKTISSKKFCCQKQVTF